MLALSLISRTIDRINTFVGYLCGLFAFLMVLLVFTVVVMRYGFSVGFIWMQEAYVWLHSFIFMLGSGFTYLETNMSELMFFIVMHQKNIKPLLTS